MHLYIFTTQKQPKCNKTHRRAQSIVVGLCHTEITYPCRYPLPPFPFAYQSRWLPDQHQEQRELYSPSGKNYNKNHTNHERVKVPHTESIRLPLSALASEQWAPPEKRRSRDACHALACALLTTKNTHRTYMRSVRCALYTSRTHYMLSCYVALKRNVRRCG